MDFRKQGRTEAFERYADDIMKRCEAVGMIVSVFDKDDVLYEKTFGARTLEGGTIDEDTIFGLASVTKSFTAMSIMLLSERGLVDLNAPVSTYLPEFRDPQADPVLVWHLLCHSGGFYPMKRILVEHVARDLGIWNDGRDELTFNESLALEGTRRVAGRLGNCARLIGKPGERLSYFNDGYGLLSEIIRRRGGETSYAGFVKKNILDPLGMTRTSAEYIAPLRDANACALYKRVGGELRGGWTFYDNAFVLPGGGSMKSTARDLRNYVRMYMNRGKPLTGEYVVREMTKIRQEHSYHAWYGYGIVIGLVDGLTVYRHGGSLPGISSNFAWVPELGIGVVTLCNTSGVPAAAISNALITLFNGGDPTAMKTWRPIEWSEEQKENACGVYQDGEGTRIEISLTDGALDVSVDGEKADYTLTAPDMLIVHHPFSTADMAFLSRDDDRPFAVRFGGRIVPREE